jgi:hypothetical protein
MFGTIRKHQTWLWGIIITLTIVSFVVFFNPSQKVSNRDSGGFYVGTIYNEPITRDQWANAQREILLQWLFSTRTWYDEQEAKRQNFRIDERTYVRLALIQKQEEMGVHVSTETAAKVAGNMLRHLEPNNPISPDVFMDKVLKPHGMGYEDFERYVRHEIGLQEVVSTMGLSGSLVTPQEARQLYLRENQEVATEAAFFSPSNYLSEITATPEAVSQYYSNALASYRLPERVQLEYVRFAYSNYFPKVEKELTNLNEIVEENYRKLGTNAFPEAKTPAEAKDKMRAEILRRQAMPLARKEANDFAQPLFDEPPPPVSRFEALAQTNGYKVEMTEPFGRDETPKGLDVKTDFARLAFSLSDTNPYAQPLLEPDAAYILAFNKRLPSEIQPFDKVKEKATMDYKLSQARDRAGKEGVEFYQKLTNGIAQGKTFQAVCTDAKIKPVDLPHFSLSTRELPAVEGHIPFGYLQRIAFGTQPGKVSPFEVVRQFGTVVHVKSTVPIDEAKMNSELPNFTSVVRQTRQREVFDKWMQKEFGKVVTDPALLRKEQEQQQQKARKTARS